jgi:hypothetical protein
MLNVARRSFFTLHGTELPVLHMNKQNELLDFATSIMQLGSTKLSALCQKYL